MEIHAQRVRFLHVRQHADLFPIAWKSSKIDGPSLRVSMPNFHGFTHLRCLLTSVRAISSQIGGLGSSITGGKYFVSTTTRLQSDDTFQYQPWKTLRGSVSTGAMIAVW